MRVSGRLFAICLAFFGLVSLAYWWLSREPAGTAALVFTGALAALVAYYLLFTARRIEPLPEDDEDGDIADAAGEYGFYSPHSWWPLAIGASAAIVGVGLIFAAWLLIAGLAALMAAIVGLMFEYYRGEFARR